MASLGEPLTPDEVWRPIPRFEGLYSVSNLGRVMSHERRAVNRPNGGTRRVRERILKAHPVKGGYLQVVLYLETEPVPTTVAFAVASAFIGPRPEGADVCHNNGDPTDNRSVNLRYGTRKENMGDCIAHGTRLCGERQGSAKLTETAVRAIRADPRTYERIAAEFGVSMAHIGAVKNRKVWKHVCP